MKRLIRRIVPRRGHRRRRIIDQGQAMFLVIAVVGILVAVPVAVNLLALNQVPTSEESLLAVQARQAAVAGISDYINHVQAAATYTQNCSNGMTSGTTQWTCPTGTAAPTASNPAFVNAPTLAGNWYSDGVTMRRVSNGTPSYRYVADSPNTSNPALVTIYSIGQAGTQTGLHVSSTEEAALTICSAGCVAPVTAATCIKVPTNAVSAQIVAYGAQGGGSGVQTGLFQDSDALGGPGAKLTATVPVTHGDTLELVPGQSGVPGKPGLISLLGLINIFAGAGGAGGKTGLGTCSPTPPNTPPDLSGGNGALPGGLVDAVTDGGGGGGGATMVFDASSPGGMVAVAGGGGGGGAGDLLSGLLGDAGPGGSAGSNPPGSGSNAAGLFPGAKGSGGVWNNPTGAGLCAASSIGGAKTQSGNGCGQDGYAGGLLGALTGGGGGGGGGYSAATLGGGGGGTTGGLLGLALGAGGGGGAGYSYANNGTCPAPTIASASPYPTGDTTGTGQIAISFFGGPCGTTPLTTVTGTTRAASAP